MHSAGWAPVPRLWAGQKGYGSIRRSSKHGDSLNIWQEELLRMAPYCNCHWTLRWAALWTNTRAWVHIHFPIPPIHYQNVISLLIHAQSLQCLVVIFHCFHQDFLNTIVWKNSLMALKLGNRSFESIPQSISGPHLGLSRESSKLFPVNNLSWASKSA